MINKYSLRDCNNKRTQNQFIKKINENSRNICGDPYEIRTRIPAVKGRLNAVSTPHKRQNQAI